MFPNLKMVMFGDGCFIMNREVTHPYFGDAFKTMIFNFQVRSITKTDIYLAKVLFSTSLFIKDEESSSKSKIFLYGIFEKLDELDKQNHLPAFLFGSDFNDFMKYIIGYYYSSSQNQEYFNATIVEKVINHLLSKENELHTVDDFVNEYKKLGVL